MEICSGFLGVTGFNSLATPNGSANYFRDGNNETKYVYSGVTVTEIQEIGGMFTVRFNCLTWKMSKK
ncbi:MAG: hypothetical protein WBV22_00900 [Anaerolineaceae bacterium]